MAQSNHPNSRLASLSPLARVGLALGFGVALAGVTGAICWIFFNPPFPKRKKTSRKNSKDLLKHDGPKPTQHDSADGLLSQRPPDPRRLNSSRDRRLLLQDLESTAPHPLTVVDSIGAYRLKMKEALKSESPDGMLSKEVLLIFNEMLIAAFLPSFKEMTFQNRKRRRGLLDAKDKFAEYASFCLEEIRDFDEGMFQSTEELLSEFGIASARYNEALSHYATVDNDFYTLIMMMFEKLKVANHSKRVDLNLEKAKEILRRQVTFMREGDSRLEALGKEETAQVKQIMMNDIIQKEFQIEEEDFLVNQIEKAWEKNEEFLLLVSSLQSLL